MENYIAIIIACISGFISISSVLINCIYDNKKRKEEREQEELKYRKSILSDAFQNEKNDKQSRISAWKEYKQIGGYNFDGYLSQLNNLPND